MISQTAEYALRAMVYLADHHGTPRTNAQIAATTEIPGGYVAKVMQTLSRAKLVNSQRGLNGGFTLAKNPAEMTVLEVVNVVDPIQRYPECPLRIASHGKTLCPLHRRLDDAAELVEESFGDTTLTDLLEVPRQQKPLCRFPGRKEPEN